MAKTGEELEAGSKFTSSAAGSMSSSLFDGGGSTSRGLFGSDSSRSASLFDDDTLDVDKLRDQVRAAKPSQGSGSIFSAPLLVDSSAPVKVDSSIDVLADGLFNSVQLECDDGDEGLFGKKVPDPRLNLNFKKKSNVVTKKFMINDNDDDKLDDLKIQVELESDLDFDTFGKKAIAIGGTKSSVASSNGGAIRLKPKKDDFDVIGADELSSMAGATAETLKEKKPTATVFSGFEETAEPAIDVTQMDFSAYAAAEESCSGGGLFD